MAKIESLTAEQQARFPEFVKKWTDIGLCTDPADRPRAEAGLRKAYEVAGLAAPKIIWCGSPFEMGVRRAIEIHADLLAPTFKKILGQSIKDLGVKLTKSWTAWNAMAKTIRERRIARESLESLNAEIDCLAKITAAHAANLYADQIKDKGFFDFDMKLNMPAGIDGSIAGADAILEPAAKLASDLVLAAKKAACKQHSKEISQTVRDCVRDAIFGQHEAGWLAFYDFFREVCGLVEHTAKLEGLMEVAKSANWFLPHKNVCWISDRAEIIERDEEGRLHCDSGPALRYRDGWSIWSIHGVRVSQQTVESPATLTVEQIIKEGDNTEKQRVMIDRFGWIRFLEESGAKVVERRRNDRDAQDEVLYRLSDGTLRFVCVDPSTGRRYALGVPRDTKSCEEAQTWMSHGLDLYATHRS